MRDKAETVNEALAKALVDTNAQLLKSNKRLLDAALLIAEHQLQRVKWELSVDQAAAVSEAQRGASAAPRHDSRPRPNGRIDKLDDEFREVPFGEDDVT